MNVLRDPELDRRLATEGYVAAGPLLPPEDVTAAARAFDEAIGDAVGAAWFPTILLEDETARAAIADAFAEIVTPHLDRVLAMDGLRVLRLDASVKPPSPESGLGPHQDFSLIDESRAQSVYVWIPLVDTDVDNGTLHVVPRSQRFANRIRSQHVPAVFDEVLDDVHRASVPLRCSAGDLVVMVSGLIHMSPPNLSSDLRVAAHGIIVPVDEPLVFYYADEATPADEVECYEVDIDTYVRCIRAGRPGPEVGAPRRAPRPPRSMSPERFRRGLTTTATAGQPST